MEKFYLLTIKALGVKALFLKGKNCDASFMWTSKTIFMKWLA